MGEFLVFEHVSKRFGAVTAVDDVSLSITRGEIFSLLGPSGCGKTTLLRMLAGFEAPDRGRIWLDGRDITDLAPNERRVHTVFQSYALFPHMTVSENIAFSLRVAHTPAAEVRRRVEAMLTLIQMTDQAHKHPPQISGGQKQRVAIARALIDQPQVLLLDEPLAALDLKLRQHMLLELDLIHDQVGLTFLYVTHDQGEAMSISDHIAVMHDGRIAQVDTPSRLYEAPRSSFVAAFIGDTNFFDGTVTEIAGDYCLLDVRDFPPIRCYNDKNIVGGSLAHLSVRPEKIHVARTAPEMEPEKAARFNIFRGRVEDVVYQGNHTKYWLRAGGHRLSAYKPHSRYQLDQATITWGDEVFFWWHADDGYMLEQYQATDASLLNLPPTGIAPATSGTGAKERGRA